MSRKKSIAWRPFQLTNILLRHELWKWQLLLLVEIKCWYSYFEQWWQISGRNVCHCAKSSRISRNKCFLKVSYLLGIHLTLRQHEAIDTSTYIIHKFHSKMIVKFNLMDILWEKSFACAGIRTHNLSKLWRWLGRSEFDKSEFESFVQHSWHIRGNSILIAFWVAC